MSAPDAGLDLDAIRKQVSLFADAYGSDQAALAHELAALVPALCDEVEHLRPKTKRARRTGCDVGGCTGSHVARGFCCKHYARFRNTGDPLGVKPGSQEARLKNDVCGTHAGHSRHRNRGEKSCDPCRDAFNAYQREWRRRAKQAVAR